MMAYRVARRTNEIGSRMASGAGASSGWCCAKSWPEPCRVWRSGLPAALGTTRLVQSFLFQMKPNDPTALAAAVAALLAAAVLAGSRPLGAPPASTPGPPTATSRTDLPAFPAVPNNSQIGLVPERA